MKRLFLLLLFFGRSVTSAPDLSGLKKLCGACVRCCVRIEESIKRGRNRRRIIAERRKQQALDQWLETYKKQLKKKQDHYLKTGIVQLKCACKQKFHRRCLLALDDLKSVKCSQGHSHVSSLIQSSQDNVAYPKAGVDKCPVCSKLFIPLLRKDRLKEIEDDYELL